MSLSAPGVGSGLDVKAIVDAYVKAEIAPLQAKHDKKLNHVNTELSAIGQLKSALSNLQTSLTKLTDLSQFYTMKYSLSDTDYFSTSITSQAVKGSYQIEVQKLAQQQSLASINYPSGTSIVGDGTITIAFGTYNVGKTTFTPNASASPVSIVIPPASNTLVGIRDKINATQSDVTAAIVQDDQGARLTITSAKSGENYSMKISGGIAALNYDPTTGVNALSETVGAQNSVVKINGLTLNQSTNQLKDSITGVTLNLKKAELGKTINLSIDDNKDQLTAVVNDFIKQYNDSMTLLTNLTGYNSATKQSGLFQGDPQFRSLKLNLNKAATSPLTNDNSTIKTLADLGITTNKQGLLEMNKDKFNKVLTNNYKEIGVLFAKTTNGNNVTKGLAVVLTDFLDTYMSSKGDLNLRADQLNSQVKLLTKEQDSIDTRSASIERRYMKQFSALDLLLTQLTSTSNSLTQQLAALPSSKNK